MCHGNPEPASPNPRSQIADRDCHVALDHQIFRDKKTIVGQYSDDGLFYEKASAFTLNFQPQNTTSSPIAYYPRQGVLASPVFASQLVSSRWLEKNSVTAIQPHKKTQPAAKTNCVCVDT